MRTQSNIPLRFNTSDPAQLQSDLDRMASSLQGYFGQLTGSPHTALHQARLVKGELNDTKLSFGVFTPVALATAGAALGISLPRPDPRNAGLSAAVLRKTTLGTITLSAPNATINGFDSVEILNAAGLYEIWFDGENYFTAPGAVWGI